MKRQSTSPCLLAVLAFDRVSGLLNRHLNFGYTYANDFEVRHDGLNDFAKE